MYFLLIFLALGLISNIESQTQSDARGAADDLIVPNSVPSFCLACMCEALSTCVQVPGCTKDVCGIFKITWAYWYDAGQLTVNDESPLTQTAYSNCANDIDCATRTASSYLKKFEQDCNHDGQINCYDYAAIHLYGGYGCNKPLPAEFIRKLDICLAAKFDDLGLWPKL